jgi:hypothetical protein
VLKGPDDGPSVELFGFGRRVTTSFSDDQMVAEIHI